MSQKSVDRLCGALVCLPFLLLLVTVGALACRPPNPGPSGVPVVRLAPGLYRMEDGSVICYMYHEKGISCVGGR